MLFFSFFILMLSLLLIDGIWLSVMMNRLYVPQIGHLLSGSLSIWPAILFYLLYGIGLYVFVVLPALKNHTGYFELLLHGLLFGMVTYGTYDLTNQATLKNWPWIVTMADIAWGAFLAATVSLISTVATRYFLER